MAAEMLTVDWRRRRCHRRRLVLLCQSQSQRGRGRQFSTVKRGGDVAPVMKGSINDTSEATLPLPRDLVELPVSWLLTGEEVRLDATSAAHCSERVTAGCGRPSAVQTRGRW